MSLFFCDNCGGRRYEAIETKSVYSAEQTAIVRCDCTVIKEETGNPTESLYWARVRWENAHNKKGPPVEDGPDPDQVWAAVEAALSIAYVKGKDLEYCDIRMLLEEQLEPFTNNHNSS